MRLLIAAIGKLKQGPERDLFAHYLGRAEAARPQAAPVAARPHRESPKSKGLNAAGAHGSRSARRCSPSVPPSYKLICLDPGGTELASEAFAGILAKFRDGGASGDWRSSSAAPTAWRLTALCKADLALSLGPMTLPHGLARIVLAEQIYRAATILAGHPYHRA